MSKPTTETLRFGPVARRRRDGKLGARAFLHRSENGWDGAYFVDTHGMNEEQVAAAIERKREHHRKKASRLDGFVRDVINDEFQVGAETWRVLDCTLKEVGPNVELFVQAAPIVGEKFDKRRIVQMIGQYTTITKVPADDAILRAIKAAVDGQVDDEARHVAFTARVKALAGGG